MSKKVVPSYDVLCYNTDTSQSTARRHYTEWRKIQSPPIPERCDNPNCIFFTEKLEWNGNPLKMILDHTDGNNSDNRPHMLRLLLPNCNSQLETNGGGNKGKIEKAKGGFAKVRSEGKKDYFLPAQTGSFTVKTSETKLSRKK